MFGTSVEYRKVTRDVIEYHCRFNSDMIHRPQFAGKKINVCHVCLNNTVSTVLCGNLQEQVIDVSQTNMKNVYETLIIQ